MADGWTYRSERPLPGGHECQDCARNGERREALRRIVATNGSREVDRHLCGRHAAKVIHERGIVDATMNPTGELTVVQSQK